MPGPAPGLAECTDRVCSPTYVSAPLCDKNNYPLEKGVCLENREKWMELCEQASKEQDPEKLLALVQEINRLLETKQERLNKQKPPKDKD